MFAREKDNLNFSKTYGGGMNSSTGFPLYFTEVSQLLCRYETTDSDVKALSKHFEPVSYSRVLDVCCGIGRVSGSMQRLGYNVTGVDLSVEQIAVARKLNPDVDYLVADMGHLPPECFDLMLNLYTSFGYFETEQEDVAVLKHWVEHLRVDGVLVMELADMDRARNRIPIDGNLTRETNGVKEILHMDWDRRLLTVNYNYNQHNWSCVTRLYEKEVLQSYLYKSGFSEVEIFGSFDFTPKIK